MNRFEEYLHNEREEYLKVLSILLSKNTTKIKYEERQELRERISFQKGKLDTIKQILKLYTNQKETIKNGHIRNIRP